MKKSWLWGELKCSSIVIWAAQRQLTGFGTECTDLLYRRTRSTQFTFSKWWIKVRLTFPPINLKSISERKWERESKRVCLTCIIWYPWNICNKKKNNRIMLEIIQLQKWSSFYKSIETSMFKHQCVYREPSSCQLLWWSTHSTISISISRLYV